MVTGLTLVLSAVLNCATGTGFDYVGLHPTSFTAGLNNAVAKDGKIEKNAAE